MPVSTGMTTGAPVKRAMTFAPDDEVNVGKLATFRPSP
jgi:hypothetical protein